MEERLKGSLQFIDLPKEVIQNTDFNINFEFENLKDNLEYPVTILIDVIDNNSILSKTIFI